MDLPALSLASLQRLAASESVSPEELEPGAVADLLARGLIRKDERREHASLEARYESLQETHHQILAARACTDRLQRQLAPRSRLAGLLPMASHPKPRPDDPDATQLFELLGLLKIQVRGVDGPAAVPGRLTRILEYLLVEGRECLDRLNDTDRALDQLQKQTPPGTLVEGEGTFVLTPEGKASLPEAPVLEALELALQAGFGPLSQRSPSAAHFHEDPASLLCYLLEGLVRDERPSALLLEYDTLLEALERIPAFSETRALRPRISFLLRLLRACREEPRRAYYWCHRERLGALAHRMHSLVPHSLAANGWHLPYAADLFLVDGGIADDEAQMELRTRLFEAVHRIQSDQLQATRIGDGQFVRLALVLTHAARTRNFAPGILLDRFLNQALETVDSASHAAPYDLGDRGTKLLFGAHLAHAAGFSPGRIQASIATYRRIEEPFQDDSPATRLPVQVLLHIFSSLERLEHLGAPLPVAEYACLLARVRKAFRHHKVVSRIFRTVQPAVGDEATLATNVCARVCFQDLHLPPDAKRHPDAGLAGLYEDRNPLAPPLLGPPFGTLMLH